MRIVSYNILNGGEGRADPLAEVIESQRPDVVVLVEADNPAVVERIAGRLGMDAIEGAGRRHGAAILSRFAIVETINHSLLADAFSDVVLEARLAIPDAAGTDAAGTPGDVLSVAAVHLHPFASDAAELKREAEIEELLKLFAGHRHGGRAHVLAGDFNANSPVQRIDPAACKARTREEWKANGGILPRRAVQKMLDAGYVDTLHAARSEEAARVGSFSTQFPGQRVDYIFAHSIDPKRIRSAWVEQDRLAKYASDHFPVGVELGVRH